MLINFQQGQDSLLLLSILTLALVELVRNRNFRAGCFLGCGLCKFHIVLTVFALLLLLRRRGFLSGFATVSVALFLISAGISGWGFLTEYPRFVRNLSSVPLAGIHPGAMANMRGLVSLSGFVHDAIVGLALTAMGSVLVFWYAGTGAPKVGSKLSGDIRLLFGNFVLAAILVSYHLSPSDLCLALLPMGLLSASLMKNSGIPRWERLGLIGCMSLLFLPPLHLILLGWHVYAYLGIPVLAMFLLVSQGISRAGRFGNAEGEKSELSDWER